MPEYTGTIQKVFNKGKRWSLLMDDDKWYGLGYKKPQAYDGQTARFQYEMNGAYRNVVEGTLQTKKGEEAPQKTAASSRQPRSDYAQKEKYWADKEARDIDTQKRISYQAAMNTAISTINLALTHDLLVFAKSAKPADKFNTVIEAIQTQAEEYFADYQTIPNRAEAIVAMYSSEEDAVEPVEGVNEASEAQPESTESDNNDDDWE